MAAEARYDLCQYFRAHGDLAEAERCLRSSFDIWPMQPLWANQIGNILMQRGNWSAACDMYVAPLQANKIRYESCFDFNAGQPDS